MTKQISQTRENGYRSNKGRIVSMVVIAGIGLALMLAATSSIVVPSAFAGLPTELGLSLTLQTQRDSS